MAVALWSGLLLAVCCAKCAADRARRLCYVVVKTMRPEQVKEPKGVKDPKQ